MIDIEIVRENYAKMLDSQLINIVKQDGHELPSEVLSILKEEFRKRNLDFAHIEAATEQKVVLLEEKIKKIKESSDKDFEKVIWNYIVNEKENGTSDELILAGLQERGLNEESAKLTLLNFKPTIKELIKAAEQKELLGGFAFIAGLAVTIISYSSASSAGGTYVIAWGAILFGAIHAFNANSEKNKNKRILDVVERSELSK